MIRFTKLPKENYRYVSMVAGIEKQDTGEVKTGYRILPGWNTIPMRGLWTDVQPGNFGEAPVII